LVHAGAKGLKARSATCSNVSSTGSPYRERFVLKGGLLLTVLGARRPTRDADVLARGVAGDEENLLAVVGEIAGFPTADGVAFDPRRRGRPWSGIEETPRYGTAAGCRAEHLRPLR
jgi:hypothetical protein